MVRRGRVGAVWIVGWCKYLLQSKCFWLLSFAFDKFGFFFGCLDLGANVGGLSI
jgi:hypothetical protein